MVAFPEQVAFQFLDEKTQQPIPNLVLLLTLLAHRKNDYDVGPEFTDKNGLVVFSRNDCLKSIADSKEMFLMDYSSSLEQCLPKVLLKIMSQEEIESCIEVRRKYKSLFESSADCSEEFFQRLRSSANVNYRADTFTFTEEELRYPGPRVIYARRKLTVGEFQGK